MKLRSLRESSDCPVCRVPYQRIPLNDSEREQEHFDRARLQWHVRANDLQYKERYCLCCRTKTTFKFVHPMTRKLGYQCTMCQRLFAVARIIQKRRSDGSVDVFTHQQKCGPPGYFPDPISQYCPFCRTKSKQSVVASPVHSRSAYAFSVCRRQFPIPLVVKNFRRTQPKDLISYIHFKRLTVQ